MPYELEIHVNAVECADIESWSSRDTFWLLGTVLNGHEIIPFSFSPVPIRPNEREPLLGSPNDGNIGRIFTGQSETNEIALVMQAYDVNHNTQWKRNREDVGTITKVVAPIVEKLAPPYGPIAEKAIEYFPQVVDLFVKYDDHDDLGHFAGLVTFPAAGFSDQEYQTLKIPFKDSTILGDWDYQVEVTLAARQT